MDAEGAMAASVRLKLAELHRVDLPISTMMALLHWFVQTVDGPGCRCEASPSHPAVWVPRTSSGCFDLELYKGDRENGL
jgi:hypothetical protein